MGFYAGLGYTMSLIEVGHQIERGVINLCCATIRGAGWIGIRWKSFAAHHPRIEKTARIATVGVVASTGSGIVAASCIGIGTHLSIKMTKACCIAIGEGIEEARLSRKSEEAAEQAENEKPINKKLKIVVGKVGKINPSFLTSLDDKINFKSYIVYQILIDAEVSTEEASHYLGLTTSQIEKLREQVLGSNRELIQKEFANKLEALKKRGFESNVPTDIAKEIKRIASFNALFSIRIRK